MYANGKVIRAAYCKLGARYAKLHVTLQIDSAGGHGTARGHGNFEKLAAMASGLAVSLLI